MVKLECQLKSENKACHEPIIVIEKIHHIQRRGTLKRSRMSYQQKSRWVHWSQLHNSMMRCQLILQRK
ncbi:MAG: hypothetical protein WBE61_12720, partial [Nitrososphaeraceae archaeon]